MSKSKHRNQRSEEIRDKPDYAADWFRPEPKAKKEPVKKDEGAANVEERLGGDVRAKLEAMKARMTPGTEPSQGNTAGRKESTSGKQTKGGFAHREEDEEESFEDLFNPKPAKDEDFAELLDSSKLDWRSFKE